MDFGLSEEQELLQRSARDFLARECPTAFVREVIGNGDGFSRSLHAKMAAMGWTGLVIPENLGGLGLSMLDLAVLAEEMGRAVVPGPFYASSVLAALSLLGSGARARQKEWLPRIAAGDAVGTLAFLEESDRLDAGGITAVCARTRDGYRLSGTKLFVMDAHVADFIVAAFRTASRGRRSSGPAVSLFLVPGGAPGVSVTPLRSIDQTRRPCEVRFRNVEVPASARLADEQQGWKVLSRVIDAACVLLAADSLGGAQRALEMSVEYAKTREQFGRPIGSFQAVKHIAAEMVSEIEPARSLVWYAAYAYDRRRREASRAASMAKARMSEVYTRTANRAVQIHGGIGFTWEHDMHLWFKRAKWNEAAFGDATFHRERLARLARL
ncbi:MAG: acyl-CoA dehydrogenase family protein [Candidatus Binatia bacterium]